MIDLNDPKDLKRYDKANMLELLESFPEQCSKARSIGNAFTLAAAFKPSYNNIVFTGVGGSAIGADLARSYTADVARSPIHVNRNYLLPRFVDEKTVVIVSSYSGNTEETLSAYKDARRKKARIIAVTSGGELEKLAKADGYPFITIPKGLPPRCALGYSFFPNLILLSKLGAIEEKGREIDEAIELLRNMKENEIGHARPEKANISKRIANALYGKYPILYGGQDHIDAVVTRWRSQLAENSKTLSSSPIFPEMNHNEIVGWENPKKIFRYITVVLLRDKDDHGRTAGRMDITKKMIGREGVKVIELNSRGNGLLARIFSLIYIGDFASYYLAILNKTDPTPVERVTYLKNELAKQ